MPNQYSGYEHGSVCSEDEHQSIHSEYDEEQYNYPSQVLMGTSASGQNRRHPSWRHVVGIPTSEVKGQPACAADPSTSYSVPLFQRSSSRSFEGGSELPPYHLNTPVNDAYRARNQPTNAENTSMSYPVSPFFRYGLNDIGNVGSQPSSAFGASKNPGYAGTHQEEYPSSTSICYGDPSLYGRGLMSANNAHVQTPSSSDLAASSMYRTGNANTQLHPSITPRYSVEPPRGYDDCYSQQSPSEQRLGDRHPHPPNTLRPQPQVRAISGTLWQPKESAQVLQMYEENQTWAEISKDSGRSVEACKGRRRLVNERNKARAAAKEQANVPDVHMIGPHCIDWSDENLIGWARGRVRTIQDEQSVTFQSACKRAAQELNVVHGLRIAGSTVEWCVKKDPDSDIEVIQHTYRGRE